MDCVLNLGVTLLMVRSSSGYGSNGPVDPSLHIFDMSQSVFVPGFTPSESGTSPTSVASSSNSPSATSTPTSPTASDSGDSGPSQTSGVSQSSWSCSTTGTAPTNSANGTGHPGDDGGGDGGGGSSGNDPGNGGNGTSGNSSGSNDGHTTAIALGTVFAALALLAGASFTAYYLRKHNRRDRFHLLGSSDDDGNDDTGAPLPVAVPHEKSTTVPQTIRGKLGVFVSKRTVPQTQRRDMLAEEDTRPFGDFSWWRGDVRREASSAQSSWDSTRSRRLPTLGEVMQDSLASLRSVSDAIAAYAVGTRSSKSREASAGSRSTAWREKEPSYEPYLDEVGLMHGSVCPSDKVSRPRGGRQGSHSSGYTAVDPFAEYETEDFKLPGEYVFDVDLSEEDLSDPPPRPYVYSRGQAAAATYDLTRLSTLTEQPSVGTLSDPTVSSDSASHSLYLSHAGTNPDTSRSSHETPRSPLPRPSSIIDANPLPSQPMRRSDSWWSRFAKTPLLDRRVSSDNNRHKRPLEFRDPQPPPRLIPIKESSHSNPPSGEHSGHNHMYSSAIHGRSASSLQTAKTANSENIEKMGRTMDIVQRGTVSSHSSGPSIDSIPENAPAHEESSPSRHLSVVFASNQESLQAGGPEPHLVQSPTEMTTAGSLARSKLARRTSPASPGRISPPQRAMSTGQVAAQVQAYERRMSQHQQDEAARLPPAAHNKRDRGSMYGVVPRAPLFVANPDRKKDSSGLSS